MIWKRHQIKSKPRRLGINNFKGTPLNRSVWHVVECKSNLWEVEIPLLRLISRDAMQHVVKRLIFELNLPISLRVACAVVLKGCVKFSPQCDLEMAEEFCIFVRFNSL